MKCPIDGTDLLITDRSGVEIDYCPQCRGVWLDRGELDKIIDRAAGIAPPSAVEQDLGWRDDGRGYGGHENRGHGDRGHGDRGHGDRGRGDHGRGDRRRREGFLGDLFNF